MLFKNHLKLYIISGEYSPNKIMTRSTAVCNIWLFDSSWFYILVQGYILPKRWQTRVKESVVRITCLKVSTVWYIKVIYLTRLYFIEFLKFSTKSQNRRIHLKISS